LNGVLLEWTAWGTPTWTIGGAAGKLRTIGGLPGKVDVTGPGLCTAIGADETVSAVAAEDLPGHYYELMACIRGPNLRRTTTEVMSLLKSTRFSDNTT
jgi:hypothetical protein